MAATGSVACLAVAKFPGGEPPPAATEPWSLSGRSFLVLSSDLSNPVSQVMVELHWTTVPGTVDTYDVYQSDSLPFLIAGAPLAALNGTSASFQATPGTHYYLVVTETATGLVSSPHVRVDPVSTGTNGLLPSVVPLAVVLATAGPGATPAFQSFGGAAAGVGDLNEDGYDDIVVGDAAYDSGGIADRGMVRLFLGTSSGLKSVSPWTYMEPAASRFAGTSVVGIGDSSGDGVPDIVVGVPRTDGVSGELQLFNGADISSGIGTPSPTSLVDPFPNPASARFGAFLFGGRDVTGDGKADLLVGARQRGSGAGSAHAYKVEGGVAPVPWTVNGLATGAVGTCVSAGDVSGDGVADVLVGEPGLRMVRAFAGGGTLTGTIDTSTLEQWILSLPIENFGERIAAGDVDADGFEDVLVGSRPVTGSTSGAFLFRGPLTGPTPDTVSDWQIRTTNDSHLGSAVALVDVNGDGYKDALVGESAFLGNPGRAILYRGGPAGLEVYPQDGAPWNFVGDINATMGSWVSKAGDVDGDGTQDFLVGATGAAGTRGRNGQRAYLFRGAPTKAPVVDLSTLKGDANQILNMRIALFDPGRGGSITCTVDWGTPQITNPAPITGCTRSALEALGAAYPTAGFYTLRVRAGNAAGLTAETATTVLIGP